MKLNFFFKLMLFTFLCAVVCIVSYLITNIEIIAPFARWFLLASYCCLVAWLCSKLIKLRKYGVNLAFCLASFGGALYFGVWLGFLNELPNINDFYNMSPLALVFVGFSLLCLVSLIILIGRLIFGSPANNTPSAANAIPTSNIANQWICSCGSMNTGRFCSQCGAQSASVTVDVSQEATTTDEEVPSNIDA